MLTGSRAAALCAATELFSEPSCSGLIVRVVLAVLEQLPAAYGSIGRTVKWGQHPASRRSPRTCGWSACSPTPTACRFSTRLQCNQRDRSRTGRGSRSAVVAWLLAHLGSMAAVKQALTSGGVALLHKQDQNGCTHSSRTACPLDVGVEMLHGHERVECRNLVGASPHRRARR